MIIDHNDPAYLEKFFGASKANRFNGAYYYSVELVENIIPLIKTDRHWVTINAKKAFDHSIVFIHNNLHPQNYNYLTAYKDLVLVCGVPETCNNVAHLGKTIYLPLSVDVEYVKQFKREKTKDCAFAGRPKKYEWGQLPPHCDILTGLPREILLPKMAEYEKICAVGRTAIEARILGCEIIPYDPRFPNPSIWKILDNKEAAKMLQEMLDEIDKEVE